VSCVIVLGKRETEGWKDAKKNLRTTLKEKEFVSLG